MKLANSVHCLAVVAMALSLGLTGCRRGPQKLTSIPGTQPGAIIDDTTKPNFPNANPFGPGNTAGPGTVTQTGQGFTQPLGDFDNPAKWTPNREMFRDQTVYFDFDKAIVKPSEVAKLQAVASRMKTLAGHALRIEGHCDERGTEEYNRTLGDRRAQAIREFLVTKEGLNPETLPTITYGEDKPADPGHAEAAFAKNRRGELVLLVPVR